MKILLATLVLALTAGGSVFAQGSNGAVTTAPVEKSAAVAVTPTTNGLSGVDSVDILDQNQAERTRDQPGNAAPTYRLVNDGTRHYSSLPALESGVLIQAKAQFPGQARATTAGEAWRQYRNGPLTMIGGWLLLGTIGAIAGMYFWRGQIKLHSPLTGRLIERFTPGERALHWSMAISFLTLAASGIIMLFGKYVLLPVFGLTLFGWLAFLCKNIHNFVGPIFTVLIVLVFIKFVKDNIPDATDIKWIAKFGGLVNGEHISAGRFNAGEKVVFWGVVVGFGLLVSASGFVLNMLVPYIEYSRGNMQIASIVHIIGALLAAAMVMGHIYLGTLGMEGAYGAMRTGYVDDTWAKEHHDLWYADVENGKIPRFRTEQNKTDVQTSTTASLKV